MDDVDRVVLDEVLDGGVSLRDAQAILGAGGAGMARGSDASEVRPRGPGGFAVHVSHEPGTDEASPYPGRCCRGFVVFHAATVTRTTRLLSVTKQKSAPFDALGDGTHAEVAPFDALGVDGWTGTNTPLNTEWRQSALGPVSVVC